MTLHIVSSKALLRILPDKITVQDRILMLLQQRPGIITPMAVIVDDLASVYSDGRDRDDGGPEYVAGMVRAYIMNLRQRGHQIVTNRTMGYRYVPKESNGLSAQIRF